MHAMLPDGTEFLAAQAQQSLRQEIASCSRKERRSREGVDDGADCVARGPPPADCVFNLAALHPAYAIKRLRAGLDPQRALRIGPMNGLNGGGKREEAVLGRRRGWRQNRS